jgi:hypothetical protein
MTGLDVVMLLVGSAAVVFLAQRGLRFYIARAVLKKATEVAEAAKKEAAKKASSAEAASSGPINVFGGKVLPLPTALGWRIEEDGCYIGQMHVTKTNDGACCIVWPKGWRTPDSPSVRRYVEAVLNACLARVAHEATEGAPDQEIGKILADEKLTDAEKIEQVKAVLACKWLVNGEEK